MELKISKTIGILINEYGYWEGWIKMYEDLVNKTQSKILGQVSNLCELFYSSNDNDTTYALTGLILELCKLGTDQYVDPIYLKEKLSIIIKNLEQIYERV